MSKLEQLRKKSQQQLEQSISNNAELKDGIEKIEITKIATNPYQSRKYFNEDSIKELAESIQENNLIQPIVVSKKDNDYIIIAGERRVRAYKLLGKTHIDALVKKFQNEQSLEILCLLENIQREDLDLFDESTAILKIITSTNKSYRELAVQLGKSHNYIANRALIATLSDEQVHEIKQQKLGFNQILELARNAKNTQKTESVISNYSKKQEPLKGKIKTISYKIDEKYINIKIPRTDPISRKDLQEIINLQKNCELPDV